MSGKIIKPEGLELVRYLNEGYIICNECGALMDYKETPEGECDLFICPSCGWEVDTMEYEYDYGEEREWSPNMLRMFGEDIPPDGCRSCDGPYPYCKTSCKLFDD